MLKTICEIVLMYSIFGMINYLFVMACIILGWALKHGVGMIEEIKQHWYVYCDFRLIKTNMLLWPYGLYLFLKEMIITFYRAEHGEIVTLNRELDEADENLF